MVRSNKENKCGFLKTSNRINVLLRWVLEFFQIADACLLNTVGQCMGCTSSVMRKHVGV